MPLGIQYRLIFQYQFHGIRPSEKYIYAIIPVNKIARTKINVSVFNYLFVKEQI